MDDVTRLLSELIAIPSVNPMGRAIPPEGASEFEGRLTDYLEAFFRERQIPCRRQAVSPGRDNLLAFYEAPGSRRTVLFDAHQDTVPADGMTVTPFAATIENGRLYGRGACDVKGSLAAMLLAVERLCRERPKGSSSVILACTVDEEFTHTGSSRLAVEPPEADLAIVAEPTRFELITSHKGAVRWKVKTHGRACHSSTPRLGDNAIYRMARVVTALESCASELERRKPDERLGPPSLSIGRIEGGLSVNIVPDECTIEVDRRVIPGETSDGVIAETKAFLRERLGSLEGMEFLPPWVNMPALSPRVSDEWLERLGAAVQTATGRRPGIGGVPYGTDAGPLSQAGIPCVVFGPGDIAQAHTEDEWIELDQLRQAVEAYVAMAMAIEEG